jgi:arylsulfatase A-like enzyme
LGDAGYDTTLVGKAHFQPLASTETQTSIEAMPTLRDLDFWRDFHGPWYGFDHIETARMHGHEYLVGQHYAIWMEEKGLANWADYFMAWPPDPDEPLREHAWDLPEELHYTTWTGERTIANIERAVEAGTPFFLWSSFHDPHPPYIVPEPWASMYDPADMDPGTMIPGELDAMPPHFRLTQEEHPDFSPWQETEYGNHGFQSHLIDEDQLRKDMAIYYGMVSFMDHQIGNILDTLDRLGVADNTIVVFTTDHGHFLGHHGLFHKGAFHYEDLLRLPFLVRWHGEVPPGAVSRDLQSLVDLAPTFLQAAGLPPEGGMQGVSQHASWHGDGPAREWAMTENRHQPTALSLRTLVTDRYKITVYRGSDDGELFDLHVDPDERHNRWHDLAHEAIKAAMLLRFVQAEIEKEPTRYPRIANA